MSSLKRLMHFMRSQKDQEQLPLEALVGETLPCIDVPELPKPSRDYYRRAVDTVVESIEVCGAHDFLLINGETLAPVYCHTLLACARLNDQPDPPAEAIRAFTKIAEAHAIETAEERRERRSPGWIKNRMKAKRLRLLKKLKGKRDGKKPN